MQTRHQLNIFANHPRQHFLHIRDRLIQVQNFRLQHLLAAERQQLLRQRRRPFRRPPNLLQAVLRALIHFRLRPATTRRVP